MTNATVVDGNRQDGFAREDEATAAWMSGILLVSLTVWILFKSGPAKYIIYTLPFTLTAAYVVVNHWQLRIHGNAAFAVLLYVITACLSIVLSPWYDFHAMRDIAIIGGYMFLFALWFRAPPSTADMALAALAIGMVVEAATEGFGAEIDLFGSNGILESILAFPLGVVLLYYMYVGRWNRALLTALIMFLAFKRIVFLGVFVAFAFDFVFGRTMRPSFSRALAVLFVIGLSILALFSTQLFEFVSASLNIERTSADSISLGRYNIAVKLWADLSESSGLTWAIGRGPGSADATVAENFELINPHNDWLKILYDYGLIGFVVLHFVLYLQLTESRLGVIYYVYGAILMMTDNIFIYMFYHPFVMLMISTTRR